MTGDEAAQLAAVAAAAERALAEQGWVPVQVMVLAKVVVDDGTREVAIACTDGMQAVETLGLLHYAIARENAGIAAEVADGDA